MKLMIASDLHGSAYYARKLAERYEAEGAEKLLLLGDLLYHGPRNDFPTDYCPKEVIPILNGLAPIILAVRGNCDSEVDQMVLDFPMTADYTALALEETTLFLTHGHVYDPESPMPHRKGDVMLSGHTHLPTVIRRDMLFLNPGSLSLPKENTPNGYMTYEKGLFTFKTVEGETYDQVPLSE